MAERPPQEVEPTVWAELGRHAHHGFQIALATGVFLAGGWWLDGKVGTAPLFTIVGALVGAAVGFFAMIQGLRTRPGVRMKEGEGKKG
jgi:F0F1-type ATP synthase assembly protein I